ncbi:MAG: AMP-binding protein [Spirochaetaceae bacterium]|jgi:long-chain acyl-CoA synthetase|nr:AMP-binding protein [Spirochaetaceae bacterium]
MLDPKEYMAPWPDLEFPNFIALLDWCEREHGGKNAIFYRGEREKDFDIWTYERLAAESRRVARGLLKQGLLKGDRVALWSENRPEWIAVWMGAAIAGCVIVPVDFLIGEKECFNILELTEPGAFFFSDRKADFAASLTSKGLHTGILVQVAGNSDFSSFGRDSGDHRLPSVDDVKEQDPVSIVFTSGTTGLAKGVTLTHKGIIANASAAVRMLRPIPEDIFINVLPLHHTYPTTCSFVVPFSLGIPTIIVSRLVGQVVINDIRDAGGTFLIAVPLLYEKVMAAIDSKYKKTPLVVRAVLDLLRKIALAEAKKGNPYFGRKVFRFIRKKAGLASINIMVAGGGALNPRTADFFDSFGFNIVHGYGMSENGPLISVSTPWHKRNESVGLPVKYTDVKIVDQNDDTRKLGTGQVGEIVVKSPSLMLGYYKAPEATAEMFTEDGYLKTGDLGYIDEDGFIFINGRKKNLIVSSGGKNIYPEEIEAMFNGSRVIGEILVLGRREASGEVIFAVVVPNYEALAEDYPGKKPDSDSDFIRGLVKIEIEKVNRLLPPFKKIGNFTLRSTEFEKNAQKKVRRFLYKDYEDPQKTPL